MTLTGSLIPLRSTERPAIPYLDLTAYDILGVNTSGGKDSQTTLLQTVKMAESQGVRDRVVAIHADLGTRVEWDGVRELVEKQCALLQVPLYVVKKRFHYFYDDGTNGRAGRKTSVTMKGVKVVGQVYPGDLLDAIECRGKWPDQNNRYCTSDFKRGVIEPVYTKLIKQLGIGYDLHTTYKATADEDTGEVKVRAHTRRVPKRQAAVLNIMGMRASESPRRAKKPVFFHDEKSSSSVRAFYDWLPLHGWSTAQVWEDIRESGIPYHSAYDKGMKRLSCKFCVFSDKPSLMIAGRLNRNDLVEYVGAETRMGHTFRQNFTLASVLADVDSGVEAGETSEDWNM